MLTTQIITLFVIFFSVSLLCVTDASKTGGHKKGISLANRRTNRLIIKGKKEVGNSSTAPRVNSSREVRSSLTSPKVEHPIRDDVKDFQTAFLIYKDNGLSPVSNENTVYRQYKSKFIFGHAVCKHVLARMEITSGLKSVELIYDALIPTNYKHANEKSDGQFKLYGAKCNYGDGANDFLFVTDTKEKQHYYIFDRDLQKKSFDNQLHLKIKACLKIVINKQTDFPVIKHVKETSDAFIAEAMFHTFKGPDVRNRRYVCTIYYPPPKENRAALICNEFRLKYKHLYEKTVTAKCGWHTFSEWIIRDDFDYEPRPYKWIHSAVECQYKLINSDDIKHILLDNTSDKTKNWKLDHYYVAEICPDSKWRLTSIVKLIEFEEYEMSGIP